LDLKADGILEYWSELVLQIPDAHEEYIDISFARCGTVSRENRKS